jgi:hypothetical protein
MAKIPKGLSSDIRLLFTSLVSLDHCIVCPLFTSSVYLFGISWKRNQRGKQKSYTRGQTIQWPIDTKQVNRSHKQEDRQYNDQEIPKRLTDNTCLPLWYLLVIVLPVLWFTRSVYLFGISWSLYCLSSDLRLLFTSLVSLGHCIVCPLIYEFCLPLWYLLIIALHQEKPKR